MLGAIGTAANPPQLSPLERAMALADGGGAAADGDDGATLTSSAPTDAASLLSIGVAAVRMLDDADGAVRAAAEALGEIGNLAVGFIPDVTLLLSHPSAGTRASAVDALRAIDCAATQKFDPQIMWRSSQFRLIDQGKI